MLFRSAPYYGAAGQNIAQAQAGAAPYQQLATEYGLAGTQAVNPQALQTATYMSPYLQQVVQPTMQALYQQQQQQQSQLAGNLAMQGAFGGDRGAIQQANLAQQQGLAASQTLGNLYNQAYQQALAAAQQQQGVNLAAQQANRAALQQFTPQALGIGQQGFAQGLGAAQAQQGLGAGILGAGTNVGQALAGYGQGLTQTGLAANQAYLGAATLPQTTQQALNTALYNQFLQQQGYPFQVSQFLANIAEGTGPLYGSTTSAVTNQPTSFFSDERAKENIVEVGRTHDDQPIYKYNYKGEPHAKRIGLIAQEVEQDHPEAVGVAGGLKTVDYDKATKHAEVHHAAEGGLVPESMGGAVPLSDIRQNYEDGGVVEYLTRGQTTVPYGRKRRFDLTSLPGGGAQMAGAARGLVPSPLLNVPEHPSEFNQLMGGLSSATGAAKTLGEGYSMGKEALFGGYDRDPKDPSKIVPTRGMIGIGGEWKPEAGTIATGAIARTVKGEPAPQGQTSATSPTITNVPESDPTNPAVRMHGGRIHRDGGGLVDPLAALQAQYAQAPWSSQPTIPAGLAGPKQSVAHATGLKPSPLLSPPPGGESALKGVSEGSTAVKNVADIYRDVFGPSKSDQPTPRTAPTASDTRSERAQIGATGPDSGPAIEPPGYSAPELGNTLVAGLAPDMGGSVSDASSIADIMSSLQAAHGGRIKRAGGGLAAALPYYTASEAVPANILDIGQQEAQEAEGAMAKNKPAPAGGGGGGGGSPLSSITAPLSAAASIASLIAAFAARGGRIHKEGAGAVTDQGITDRALQIAQAAQTDNAQPRPKPTVETKKEPGVAPVVAAPGTTPAPKEDRDFVTRAYDFATKEQNIIPLLIGLGTMASSPSRYLGSAILQGLAGGAQQYYQMGTKATELGIKQQEANTQRAAQLSKMLTTSADAMVLRAASGQDMTGAALQYQQIMNAYSKMLGISNMSADQAKIAADGWKNGTIFDKLIPSQNPYYYGWLAGLNGNISPELAKHFLEARDKAMKEIRDNGGAETPDGGWVTFEQITAARNQIEAQREATKTTARTTAEQTAPTSANLERALKAHEEARKQVAKYQKDGLPVPPELQKTVEDLSNEINRIRAGVGKRTAGGRIAKQGGGGLEGGDEMVFGPDIAQAEPEPQVAQAPPAAPATATPAAPVPPAVPAPPPAPAAPRLRDDDNPAFWQGKIDEGIKNNYQPEALAYFREKMNKAAERIAKGEARNTDNSPYVPPGELQRKAEERAIELSANKRVEQNYAVLADAQNSAIQGQTMINQAKALLDIAFDENGRPRISTGPGGEQINRAAAYLKQAGFSDDFIRRFMSTDPTRADELNKLTTSFATEIARQDLPGAAVRQQEFLTYMKTVPGQQVLPAAFRYITENIIIPKAQYHIDAYNHVADLDPAKANIPKALVDFGRDSPWYTPSATARPTAPAAGPKPIEMKPGDIPLNLRGKGAEYDPSNKIYRLKVGNEYRYFDQSGNPWVPRKGTP